MFVVVSKTMNKKRIKLSQVGTHITPLYYSKRDAKALSPTLAFSLDDDGFISLLGLLVLSLISLLVAGGWKAKPFAAKSM